MRIPNTLIALIVSTLVWSCIEELEPLDSSIEKVYGFNSNSQPVGNGISRNADGSFLVYGVARRSITNFDRDQAFNTTKDSGMPFMVKIDEHGNEIITRTYPIDQIEYLNVDYEGYFNIEEAIFDGAIEMPNGKVFATFRTFTPEENFRRGSGFMILDQDLNVEKLQLFDDTPSKNTGLINRANHQIFISPTENEVIVLASVALLLSTDYRPLWNTLSYSIFRVSLDGTIVETYDYDMDPQPLLARDMIIDTDGSAIVVGQKGFDGIKSFIHRIDLQTGDIIEEIMTAEEANGQVMPKISKIRPTVDGYILILNEELKSSNTPKFSTNFYDHNFNLINRSYITHATEELPLDSIHSFQRINILPDFISMQSGGFCAFSYTPSLLVTVHRLDDEGNEVWRWQAKKDEQDGPKIGRLIEASDGGVILLQTREFNSTGFKMMLTKLDSYGNL